MEATQPYTTEQSDGASTEFFPNSIEERIKANLESLHAQISMLTQMMNKIV